MLLDALKVSYKLQIYVLRHSHIYALFSYLLRRKPDFVYEV